MKNVSLDNGAKNPHDKKSLTNPIVDKDKIISAVLKLKKMRDIIFCRTVIRKMSKK